MNHDLTTNSTENEQDTVAPPTRRPIRRARRTVAPFAKEIPSEPSEKNEDTASVAEAIEPTETTFENVVATESTAASDETQSPIDGVASDDAEETVETNSSEFSADTSAVTEIEEEREKADEETTEEADENTTDDAAETSVESEEEEEKLSPVAEAFDWVKSFLFSLTAVIFIFTLIFRGVTVNGGSMLPTLENGEYLIISDLLYTPKNGDIVVVQSPHYKNATEPLIKRVIATGGQTVKINFNTWEVFVDGNLVHEDYILKDGATAMNCEDLKPDENGEVEFKVDEGCVFVMGDHRNDSLDSRSNSVGQIDERYIMGRVVIRLSPIERFGKVA